MTSFWYEGGISIGVGCEGDVQSVLIASGTLCNPAEYYEVFNCILKAFP